MPLPLLKLLKPPTPTPTATTSPPAHTTPRPTPPPYAAPETLQCPARNDPQYGVPRFDHVDAVFTYVNGADSAWRASFDLYTRNRTDHNIYNRYRDWGELRYAMRSVAMYAPWVRRLFLVVASPSQVPAWLHAQHPRARIVYHDQLFDNTAEQLPTFNSLAIESVLHRIPGLSEYFLYFNNGARVSMRQHYCLRILEC